MPPSSALLHGGRLAAARQQFPDAPEPWVDLSTGINPHAYPLPALQSDAFTRLPDPDDEWALRDAAARAYGVPPPCVAAAPGTQLLIGLLPRLFPHASVAVLAPTYAEHAAAWRAAGADVREPAGFGALSGAEVAVVCTPNNPDGRRTAIADILEVAARAKLVVVDEAFADLEDDPSAVAALPHPALLILRSFGKPYGLAGLRLGFALAAPARAASIRDALGPWAVSGPALAAGRVALRDTTWRAAARVRLAADATRLDAMLAGAGLAVLGGTRLFRLAEHPGAARVHRRLGEAGILARRFDDHPRWLRFGIPGTPHAWNRLRAALAGL